MDSLMWSFSQEYNIKQQPSFKNFKTKVVKGGFQSDWKATPNSVDCLVTTKKKTKKHNNLVIHTTSMSACSTFDSSPKQLFETKKKKKQAILTNSNQPLQIPKSNQVSNNHHSIPSPCPNPPQCVQQFNMLVSTVAKHVFTPYDYSPTNLSSTDSSANSSTVSNSLQSPTADFDSCSIQNSPSLSNFSTRNETSVSSRIEKPNKMTRRNNRTAISIRELLN